jgi:DNA-binding NtrC family response regulator
MTSVLVIDRNAETRLVARRVLERAGFAVSTAAATAISPGGVFNLVVADLTEVSLGYLQRRYPQVRVLAISSEGEPDLAKPFTPSQLLTAVRLCLARRED